MSLRQDVEYRVIREQWQQLDKIWQEHIEADRTMEKIRKKRDSQERLLTALFRLSHNYVGRVDEEGRLCGYREIFSGAERSLPSYEEAAASRRSKRDSQ